MRARSALASLGGWQRAAMALVLGALSVLAVAPVFAAPVLFLTFPCLAWMLDEDGVERTRGRSIRRVAMTGWWFGFGYFVAGLHWIVEPFLVEAETFAWLIPFAITLLPGGLALFFSIAAVAAHLMWSPGWRAIFPLALSFGFVEWLRGTIFTGFPWNLIGHALTGHDVPLQLASIIGVNGLTVLSVLFFALPGLLLTDIMSGRTRHRNAVFVSLAFLAITGLAAAWGIHRQALAISETPGVRLRLVQPAIPQAEKWKPENRQKVFSRHISLSRQNSSGQIDNLSGTTHVIWPESAIPFLLLRTPQALQQIADMLPPDTQLITGALRIVGAEQSPAGKQQFFNSLMAFDTDARLIARYDKTHLVPFGEYLPFQALLETIGLRQLTQQRGGFATGTDPRAMVLPGTPVFSPLVCYEGIFSGAVVTTPDRPEWLLVVTNDAWFGAGAGPLQHFHHARIRAVEEGLPLVRVSNNGISAVIDPLGRTRERLGLNIAGTIDARLPHALPPTVFSVLGSALFWGLLAACLLLAGLSRRWARNISSATQP